MNRRRYLLAVAGVSAGIAGCSEDSEPADNTTNTTESTAPATESGEETPESTSTADEEDEDRSASDSVTGDGETGLDVVHVAGDRVTDAGITRIRMLVTPATPGNVDLSEVTVELTDSQEPVSLTYSSTGGDTTFTVQTVQDTNETLTTDPPVLDDLTDHAELLFDVPAAMGDAIEGGTTVDVTVRTAGDIESRGQLVTPTTLIGSAIELGTGIEPETDSEMGRSRLVVEGTSGTAVDGSIQTVTTTVRRNADGEDIDLGATVLRYLGPAGVFNLTHENTGSNGAAFTTSAKQDEDDSIPVLNDGQDSMSVTFDGTAVGEDDGLSGGDAAVVHFVTPSGGLTTARLIVPQSLPESGDVAL